MKNNIPELVFILDRSGSMAGLETDTIGGFNAMIEKQKKPDGTVYVSTLLFANDSTGKLYETMSEVVCSVRCSAPIADNRKDNLDCEENKK